MAERRRLSVPTSHGNEAEHRRLLAQAVNQFVPSPFIGSNLLPAEDAAAARAAIGAAATADIGQWLNWTPTLTFATPGDLSVTYTTRVGRYMRVGNSITVTFNVVTATFTHGTASGELQISGLPFTAANVSGLVFTGALVWSGITKTNYTNITARVSGNEAVIDFSAAGSGQSASAVDNTNVPTGGTVVLQCTVTYEV